MALPKPIVPLLWAGLVLALDLFTKYLASSNLEYLEARRVTSFFNLVLVYNKGAAFSLFASDGSSQALKMSLLSLVATVPLIYFYRLSGPRDWWALGALGAIFGGALGNVTDRLRLGAVVDFLDFHWGERHWPAFNVADMAICIGVGILFLTVALSKKANPSTGKGRAAAVKK
jgi:signal peptidase II